MIESKTFGLIDFFLFFFLRNWYNCLLQQHLNVHQKNYPTILLEHKFYQQTIGNQDLRAERRERKLKTGKNLVW